MKKYLATLTMILCLLYVFALPAKAVGPSLEEIQEFHTLMVYLSGFYAEDFLKRIREMLEDTPSLVNARNFAGFTPLHAAIIFRNEGAILKLLEHPETDVNARHYGCTPLHIAVYERNVFAVKALLRDPRTNIDAKDEDGVTALELCAQLLLSEYSSMGKLDYEYKRVEIHHIISRIINFRMALRTLYIGTHKSTYSGGFPVLDAFICNKIWQQGTGRAGENII